jgi:hypothetical protein
MRNSPLLNGEGPVWKQPTERCCAHLDGKALFAGALRLHAAVHREMHETKQQEESDSKDDFREQSRRKRNPSDEQNQVKRISITRDPKAKLANTELTPQAIWPTAKSLSNRDGPRAPTAIHGLLGLKYHPADNANATADCLENRFMTCVKKTMNGRWRLESKLCSKLQIVAPLKE